MTIAELKADHQASVIQQQPVTISEEGLRLRVIQHDPRLLAEEANISSQKAGMSDGETGN